MLAIIDKAWYNNGNQIYFLKEGKKMKDISRNLTMLCDFYELTMANGYFKCGLKDTYTYFDVFFRSNPDGGGYAIAAGLEQIISYINNLHFTECDIEFLRSKNLFDEDFLEYLADFRFDGDIWAVPEGTPMFPNEPIITVRAPAIQAQFIETFLLLTMNHQCLIATKAARITRAAKGRSAVAKPVFSVSGSCRIDLPHFGQFAWLSAVTVISSHESQ